MPRRVSLTRAGDRTINEWAGATFANMFDSEVARELILGPVVIIAKSVVPVDTGRLRDSIRRVGQYIVADAVNPRNGFRYALLIELTHTPYMRIALQAARVPARFPLRQFAP